MEGRNGDCSAADSAAFLFVVWPLTTTATDDRSMGNNVEDGAIAFSSHLTSRANISKFEKPSHVEEKREASPCAACGVRDGVAAGFLHSPRRRRSFARPHVFLSSSAVSGKREADTHLRIATHTIMLAAAARWRIPQLVCRIPPKRSLVSTSSTPATLTKVEEQLDVNDDQEEEDLDNPNVFLELRHEPYRSLLTMSARARWRVTNASMPKYLEEAQRRVLDATPLSTKRKITKQHLLKMMEAQQGLRNRRETERREIFLNRRKKKNETKDKEGNILFYGPEQAVAAVKHRLYPQFAMSRRVLTEASSLVPSFRPQRVLDFGTGVGSAAVASWDVFGSSLEWFHLIDASKTMREVAETVLEEVFSSSGDEAIHKRAGLPAPRITTATHVSAESEGTFDLCLASFTMSDLPNMTSILAATGLLYAKLKPGGLLVVLEPGTPDGFGNIRMIRNMLLDCCPEENEDGCRIVAPCTHSGKCPIERNYGYDRRRRRSSQQDDEESSPDSSDPPCNSSNDSSESESDENDTDPPGTADTFSDDSSDSESDENYSDPPGTPGNLSDSSDSEPDENDTEEGTRVGFCSFVQSSAGFSGWRQGEKLSYLVVQKKLLDDEKVSSDEWMEIDVANHLRRRLQVNAEHPLHEHLEKEGQELQFKFLNSDSDDLGLEFLRNPEKRKSFGRIIEAPRKRRGHVLIDCCVDGRIERHTFTKSTCSNAPGLYAAARKSRWGGFFVTTDASKSKS
jgi:ribosomal protein RSM22 (predicted rRNA methylase)